MRSSLPRQELHRCSCSMTLLEKNGRIIFGTSLPPDIARPAFVPAEVLELFRNSRQLQEYTSDRQVRLMGIAFPLEGLPWSILVEENKEDIYAGLMEARNRILLIAILLTIVIGGGAIGVARQIMIPLKDLTSGVLMVANGDLEVTVPRHRHDELGIVTTMFNEMVRRLREDQLRLEEMATTDPLTGLANRKQIMTALNLQMEGYCRHATDFAVLMLDIDFFKDVNDSYGHQAGDAVLCEVARILNSILRSRDTAGRYGGEEFMVILDTTDLSQGVVTAERIRKAVEDLRFNWKNQVLRITVSIGVTAITVEDTTIDAMISRVDKALYKAKDEGRNRIISDEDPILCFLAREKKSHPDKGD
jgi:diguanylate cyclase (GGDEF)-like protein